MSKRSFDESRGSQPSEADHNGLLPIHELLSPDEHEHEHEPTPPAGHTKKPRNFIATVVCHGGVPSKAELKCSVLKCRWSVLIDV